MTRKFFTCQAEAEVMKEGKEGREEERKKKKKKGKKKGEEQSTPNEVSNSKAPLEKISSHDKIASLEASPAELAIPGNSEEDSSKESWATVTRRAQKKKSLGNDNLAVSSDKASRPTGTQKRATSLYGKEEM
ncbi:hypothetical protein LTR93_010773 [Exophiala xenobiotica]|nr:hypothetical protein LTR93_010773 [Exophiala xenobiotica]